MKSTIATALFTLFAATSLAAPTQSNAAPQYATVSLSNDMTGAYGNVQVPIDGSVSAVSSLYASTAIGANGNRASSTSLVGGLAANPTCTFTLNGVTIAQLTSTKTFQKFGTNPNQLEVVDLSAATLSCSAY